jgi:glyoxylase-like metal-dependent hydrolase (beta-lactamase superfamily II)
MQGGEKMRKFILATVVATALSGLFAAPAPLHAQDAKRSITKIAGDLYRFQNNFHFSVFLVTPDGIIATDPINAQAAKWLKGELKSRFGVPVKYLIYSHDHVDHSSGGEVFAPQATVIAHERARATIIGEQRPTATPEVTFTDRMTVTLGGKSVELIYLGLSHSDNMIVMHFPEERALYTVDFVSVKRLPYKNLSDAYMPEWIDAVRQVEAMDFDILVPGHGPVGTRADATEHRQYLQALYSAVLDGARKGQSLDDMKKGIMLEEFKHMSMYDKWRELNIEGVYARVMLHRRGN